MTTKELIRHLSEFPEHTQVFLSSDEEMNTLYSGMEASTTELEKSNGYGTFDACVLYPLSGTERFD